MSNDEIVRLVMVAGWAALIVFILVVAAAKVISEHWHLKRGYRCCGLCGKWVAPTDRCDYDWSGYCSVSDYDWREDSKPVRSGRTI